MKTGRFPTTEE